jgi:hypothetical protein
VFRIWLLVVMIYKLSWIFFFYIWVCLTLDIKVFAMLTNYWIVSVQIFMCLQLCVICMWKMFHNYVNLIYIEWITQEKISFILFYIFLELSWPWSYGSGVYKHLQAMQSVPSTTKVVSSKPARGEVCNRYNCAYNYALFACGKCFIIM